MYDFLFSPTQLHFKTIKNRIVAAPPPTRLCENDGNLSPQFFSYYSYMAEKEPGIIIIDGLAISNAAKGWLKQGIIADGNNFRAISELVNKLRKAECFPMIQLYHGGINAIPTTNHRLLGLSKITHNKIKGDIKELTSLELDAVAYEYGLAASLAWNAGFAGIEIEASEGSLIHQSLSPITNKRSDQFSYKANSGAHFLMRVIEAVKNSAPDLLISVKLSLRDLVPGGAGLSDCIAVAKKAKEAGASLFHLSQGLKIGDVTCLHPTFRGNISPSPLSEDALVFKKETGFTTILGNGMHTPEIADNILARGISDFISLSRTLNREPNWINLASRNQPIEFFKRCKRCMTCVAASGHCPEEKTNQWRTK